MNEPDALSRLCAGLDLDEEIAQAAASRAAEWKEMEDAVVGGPFFAAEPEHLITESGTHTIVYPEGWPLTAEAQHIARQDPKATLDRVEAIRKVLALHDRACDPELQKLGELDRARIAAQRETLEFVIEELAAAYADETEGANP